MNAPEAHKAIASARLHALGPVCEFPPEKLIESIPKAALKEGCSPKKPYAELEDYVLALGVQLRPSLTDPFGETWSRPWWFALRHLQQHALQRMELAWHCFGSSFDPAPPQPSQDDALLLVFKYLHGNCDCFRHNSHWKDLTPADQVQIMGNHLCRHTRYGWDPASMTFSEHASLAFIGKFKADKPDSILGSMLYSHWNRPGPDQG